MTLSSLARKQRVSMKAAVLRVNIWEGAVRSGKTICSIRRWIEYIRNAPAGNLLMVGKTERTLKRNIIDVMVQMLGHKRCKFIAGKGELWVCGRMVYVVGANDESAQEKIRGLTLAGAYGDEVSIWPESFFTMLLSRLSIKGAKFFGTTNPDNPSHWLKKLLDRAAIHLTGAGEVLKRRVGTKTRKGKVINWARMTFKLADNPYLPKEYVRSLMSEYTGLWYRRFILGHWVAAEGSVYGMWDENKHICDELPIMKRVYGIGIDYGTTNPTAGIMLGLGVDDVLYAFNEWAPTREATDVQLQESLDAHFSVTGEPDYLFIDPAAKSLRRQLQVTGHRGIKKASNDVDNGIRLVASLLSMGRLRIHASCENLLDEIPGYSWNPKQSVKGKDEVIKENDHYCDALRYVIYSSKSLWRHVLHLPTLNIEPANYEELEAA